MSLYGTFLPYCAHNALIEHRGNEAAVATPFTFVDLGEDRQQVYHHVVLKEKGTENRFFPKVLIVPNALSAYDPIVKLLAYLDGVRTARHLDA